ncbi:MAG: DUF2934 domain-containing protein [Candidatus Omnitrophica bacterium]|nr:DUF2934 domain-containing protein [Candidatus Omnitrophota bacterium]
MAKKNGAEKKYLKSGNFQDNFTPEQVEEKIRTVAHEIYLKKGCTPGHALEDWLMAEKAVQRELQVSGSR